MSMIDWLYGLQHFGVKLGLDNIRALLDAMGRPDRAFPSAIVAGTNGKGSVAAMMHAVLCASGQRAGLFTSPHLVRPTERIRVGTEDVSADELDRLLASIRHAIGTGLESGRLAVHPSFFEVVTAAALEAFRRHAADVAILEVGLGGRLDATNAVDAELAVVVNVDLDHVKSLGPTVERIAIEKAGVIKPGKPVVSGALRQNAISVLRRTARERGARWIDARGAVSLEYERDGVFGLRTAGSRYDDLKLSLPGRHQIDNARVALAALETLAPVLGIKLDADSVRRGLASTRWPGRLQWRQGGPGEPEVLFDGAHNPAGAETLADYLARLGRPAPVAVLGAMHGKLLPEMLRTIGPHLHAAVVTRPDVRRAAEPEEVAEVARRWVPRVEIEPAPPAAFERAQHLAGDRRFVLVTGSLYLVGAIQKWLDGRPAPGPVSM